MFGAIAGGIASALAGGAMSKLFGGGQKAASGGIQGDVLATDNNTVGMGDAGIKSAIQGSNVPNPDEARSEERFSRNAETDLVCRLLLEKKKVLERRVGRPPDGGARKARREDATAQRRDVLSQPQSL